MENPGAQRPSQIPAESVSRARVTPPKPRRSGLRIVVGVIVVLRLLALGGFLAKHHSGAAPASGGPPGQRGAGAGGPVPVVPGTVTKKDVPIFLDGLGTVQAFNTVTIRARVDGQVQKIAFVEGRDVHAGDLLAQIDPAPFQAQLDQNVAKQAQDQAQLTVARVTLQRDATLL